MNRRWILLLAVWAAVIPIAAQTQPDPRQMSGLPRPATDLPADAVSVRVLRGDFAHNVTGADVAFVVDGKTTILKTDDGGRAQIAGLAPGARIKASTTVDGQRLESQDFTMGPSGVRLMLVAAAGGVPAPAIAPVSGRVVLGPESRIVAEFSSDRLNMYYAMQVVNAGAAPVDIGGPLVFDLPAEARSVSLLEQTTPQAATNGTRVIVTGPFAPGTTRVNLAFELPHSSGSVRIEQKFPATMQQLTAFALRTGGMDLQSPQMPSRQTTTQQGEPIVVIGGGPEIPAGQTLVLDITGLPHHPTWPRYTALALAGVAISLGLWAAVFPSRRGDHRGGGHGSARDSEPGA